MKILLVDDSKSARYALRLQLQRHGLEVETAESAEAAFEVLRKSLPDAILMDHMMPGLNGFEALEVIREDPRTASIPIIMCTSHEEPDFVATAKKKGVFGILPKSAAPDLLPEILERLRAKLGAGAEHAPAQTHAAPAQPAAPGLSEEAVIKLIEARLEARLSRIIPPLMDEIRRDLGEGLLNESQRLIDERFAAEQAAQRTAPPKPTMADLQAISTRLATETLPDLIKRGLEAERANLLESLEKTSHRSRAAGGQGQEGDMDLTEEAAKAAAAARRETQEAIESALSSSQQSLQAVESSLRGAMGRIYTLVALAALAGIGAAAGVYFMLQP